MSNELQPTQASDLDLLRNPDSALAYLQTLVGQEDDSVGADVNINDVTPRLVMNNMNEMLAIRVGDQDMASVKSLTVLILASRGSRALWAPEHHPAKEEFKWPVCSTGLVNPHTFSAGGGAKGTYLVNEHFPLPYPVKDATGNVLDVALGERIAYECDRCPFNVFGSEPSWDPDKTGNGKACKEGRTLFLVPLVRLEGAPTIAIPGFDDIFVWRRDEQYGTAPLRFPFSFASNRKSLSALNEKAAALRKPPTALAWKLSVKLMQEGQLKWPVLQVEFAGIPAPSVLPGVPEDKKWIEEFVRRNAVAAGAEASAPF